MLKSTNPILARMDNEEQVLDSAPMTVDGTIGKALILIAIAAIAGGAVFYQASLGYSDKVSQIMTFALIGGLIFGFAAIFVHKLTKFFAPIYAFCEGALLCGISLMLETQFPGIAVQAISGTLLCFAIMLLFLSVVE